MSKNLRLFQIYYNEETRNLLDPAFTPLDNSENPRPDWAEYWPIRNLLNSTTFAEDDYIGVFSPRFSSKTGIDGASARQLVDAAPEADMYSLSPYFDQGALHLSPFEQGERKHPGLMPLMEKLLPELAVTLNPRELVCDQTTTIFANYFIARYTVWRAWFALSEQIFRICEAGDSDLARELNQSTLHRGTESYPMKVFVMERLITVVLEFHRFSARYCLDLQTAPKSVQGSQAIFNWLLICDALKGQYKKTGNPLFINQYLHLRSQLFSSSQQKPQGQP